MLTPHGDALGSFWGASGYLGEALWSSSAALWSTLGCFKDVSGRRWGALVCSEDALPDEEVNMLDLLYLSAKNNVCEVAEVRLEHVLNMSSHGRASCKHAGS